MSSIGHLRGGFSCLFVISCLLSAEMSPFFRYVRFRNQSKLLLLLRHARCGGKCSVACAVILASELGCRSVTVVASKTTTTVPRTRVGLLRDWGCRHYEGLGVFPSRLRRFQPDRRHGPTSCVGYFLWKSFISFESGPRAIF